MDIANNRLANFIKRSPYWHEMVSKFIAWSLGNKWVWMRSIWRSRAYNAWQKAAPIQPISYSVVIPTIWKSAVLTELVEVLNSSDWVKEIILIDNAGEEGRHLHTYSKVKVQNQPTNLYVNPAWNLGVSLAQSSYVILCNDDILFNPSILKDVSKMVVREDIGLIGIYENCFFKSPTRPQNFHWRFLPKMCWGFGTLLIFHKQNYLSIPKELKVWYGDSFLFTQMTKTHLGISGISIQTQMSSSSDSPVFNSIKEADLQWYDIHYAP